MERCLYPRGEASFAPPWRREPLGLCRLTKSVQDPTQSRSVGRARPNLNDGMFSGPGATDALRAIGGARGIDLGVCVSRAVANSCSTALSRVRTDLPRLRLEVQG